MFVSVIIPVYNTKDYIVRCVESVEAQNFEDYEILIIDDGSTDGSSAVCDELSQRFDNVKVFHKENGGVSSARNLGLDNAKGEYVIFIDSDDTIRQGYFSFLKEREGAGVIRFDSYAKSPSSDLRSLRQIIEDKEFPWEVWKYAFKRELIEQAQVRFDERIIVSEDLCFVLCVLLHAGVDILVVRERFYDYTRRPGSAMNRRFSTKQLNSIMLTTSTVLDVVRKQNSEDMRFFERWLAGHMWNYYFNITCMGKLSEDEIAEVSKELENFYDVADFHFFTVWRLFAKCPRVGAFFALVYVRCKYYHRKLVGVFRKFSWK